MTGCQPSSFSALLASNTEAKLRHLATEVLSELKKKTVDYRQNYDGTISEPIDDAC